MAKDKETDLKNAALRPKRQKEKSEKTDRQEPGEIGDTGREGGNPEWWRGDPDKRGEVL